MEWALFYKNVMVVKYLTVCFAATHRSASVPVDIGKSGVYDDTIELAGNLYFTVNNQQTLLVFET